MKNSWLKYLFGLMILVLILIWSEIARSPAHETGAEIFFFDVGQGDSALIQRNDYQILIDGGPDNSILTKIGGVMPLYDRTIEMIVLTHPHADHLVGLNQIMGRYEVKQVYFSGAVHTSNQYLEFLAQIKEKNIEAVVPGINSQVVPFDQGELTFLWPGERYKGKGSCSSQSEDSDSKYEGESAEDCISNLNNVSEVIRFCFATHCVLLTGDLETDGQDEMWLENTQADFLAEILKISHHGSGNATTLTLLEKVNPEYAVISVGDDNRYGHPNAGVIKTLEEYFKSKELDNASNLDYAKKILRTDRDATIKFLLTPSSVLHLSD